MIVTARSCGAVAAAALAIGAAGCGSGGRTSASRTTTTPTAYTAAAAAGANPVAVPPVTAGQLESGSAQHQITEAIAAFYRAAWEDNAAGACALFSPAGRAGFMHAAAMSFPSSVNKSSTCEHAMEIYNAALTESAQTTADNISGFSTAALDNVTAAEIRVTGTTATAIAPTNIAALINPMRFLLVRVGHRWLINGSRTLNKSNLAAILKRAQASGQLTPRKRHK
jgi:hypothetical protein